MPSPILIAAMMNAAGSIIGGISAKKTGELNAYNIETEKKLSDVQAKERGRLRVEEYRNNLSANIATFAAAGRDVGDDASVRAFFKKQKQIAAQDISAIESDKFLRSVKYQSQASAERSEGRAKFVSSLFSAGSSIAGGIHDYQRTKT